MHNKRHAVDIPRRIQLCEHLSASPPRRIPLQILEQQGLVLDLIE